MIGVQIKKTIRKYSKIIGMPPEVTITVFNRGDVHQKKRDLIAMRFVIYAKEHRTEGMTQEDLNKLMVEFAKTENLNDTKWPIIPNLDEIARSISEKQDLEKRTLSKSDMSVLPKSSLGAHNLKRSKRNPSSKMAN